MVVKKHKMHTWDNLQKQVIWQQLHGIEGQRILDFGSGYGHTANYYAKSNEVVAVEPNQEMILKRVEDYDYHQLVGDHEILYQLEDRSFDWIFCHNVLEYVEDRDMILKALSRLLKDDGKLSIIKHNPNGRVMQMIVLLNDFDHGDAVLNGENSHAKDYGEIKYYDTQDILDILPEYVVDDVKGIRNFWHLQQHQEIQTDLNWQNKMIDVELKCGELDAFKEVASFHHIILSKKGSN